MTRAEALGLAIEALDYSRCELCYGKDGDKWKRAYTKAIGLLEVMKEEEILNAPN